MSARINLAVGVGIAAIVAAVVAGCSGSSAETAASSIDGGTDASAVDEDGGVGAEGGADAGNDTSTNDAQTGDGATATGLFAEVNAGPFTGGTPSPGVAKGNADHLSFAGGDPAGSKCFDCHANFAFAGTLYKDENGTARVAGAQVLVRRPNGTSLTTFTDSDGNFWYPGSVADVPAGSRVAIRNATDQADQLSTISSGSCVSNGCHGSTTPKVHLP